MFRKRKNLAKLFGKKLAPNSKQLRSVFQEFGSNSVFQESDRRQENAPNSSASKLKRKRSESYYRDKLAKSLNGKTEVVIPGGRIDILSANQIIEVKHIRNWKAALGQILVYGSYYPHHQKRIHLFGQENDLAQIRLITDQCQKQNIVATFED